MQRYLGHIRADATLLLAAAAGRLDAAVPACEPWRVADLLDHLGHVYLHKVEGICRQRRPDPWPPPPHGRDPIEWLRERTEELLTVLGEHDPADPAPTWRLTDQTVGFWYRRMAQETVVHRVDAEQATGAATSVDDALAVDGIDEALTLFLAGDRSDRPHPGPTARVGLRAGERSWLVLLEPGQVRIRELSVEVTPDAVVHAGASELYLWLWGRRPDEVVRVDGDPDAAAGLRAAMSDATG